MTDPQPPVPVPEIETLLATWLTRAEGRQWQFQKDSAAIMQCVRELEAIRPSLVQERTRLHGALQAETQRRQEAETIADKRRREVLSFNVALDKTLIKCEELTAELQAERTARQQAERERDEARESRETDEESFHEMSQLYAKTLAQLTASEQARAKAMQTIAGCLSPENQNVVNGDLIGSVRDMAQVYVTSKDNAREALAQLDAANQHVKIAQALAKVDHDSWQKEKAAVISKLATSESSREALRTALETQTERACRFNADTDAPTCNCPAHVTYRAALLAAQARETTTKDEPEKCPRCGGRIDGPCLSNLPA